MNASNDWVRQPARALDRQARRAARARQARLTKPAGALGRLETVAVRLAGMQGSERPEAERVHLCVFAADHGVAAAGVSAYPQAVTGQMIANMAAGGAAVSVVATAIGARLELIVLGTVSPVPLHPRIRLEPIAAGTANLAQGPAMTAAQLARAMAAGRAAVGRALEDRAQLFIGGEMGIGNTTAAAALACALLSRPAAELVGPGTGLDRAGVAHKGAVVARALALHGAALSDPLGALARVGGFEIAALAGAYCACAQSGLPVLVDGFISSVAALAATRLCDGAGQWMLLAHASAEPGHRLVVEALGDQPLLDLGMRLGEGSGAAVAVPLLRLACVLHNGMATFDEARVSGADG